LNRWRVRRTLRAMARTQKTAAGRVRTALPELRPFKRAAQEIGISYSTLRDAHFRGDLAVVRVGRSWYVAVNELNRFVEQQTEPGGR
jgi:hypothetical protein